MEKEERGGEVDRKDRKELGRVSGSIPHHGLKFGVGFGAVLWGAMGGGGGCVELGGGRQRSSCLPVDVWSPAAAPLGKGALMLPQGQRLRRSPIGIFSFFFIPPPQPPLGNGVHSAELRAFISSTSSSLH